MEKTCDFCKTNNPENYKLKDHELIKHVFSTCEDYFFLKLKNSFACDDCTFKLIFNYHGSSSNILKTMVLALNTKLSDLTNRIVTLENTTTSKVNYNPKSIVSTTSPFIIGDFFQNKNV